MCVSWSLTLSTKYTCIFNQHNRVTMGCLVMHFLDVSGNFPSITPAFTANGTLMVPPFELYTNTINCTAYQVRGRPQSCPIYYNTLMLELNPSLQCCLTRFFSGDFASWTVHFVNICVKNQQMQ
jgi:hypothetical protein